VSQQIEIPQKNINDLQFANMQSRQQIFNIILRLQPIVDNAPIQGGILAPGTYKGNTFTKDARIDGLGWPVVNGPVTFSANIIVRGVVFADTVALTAAAVVVFDGCVFQKTVTVASGGKGAWSGCRFDGTSSIQNGGNASKCVVAGGVHTSSTAHVNVTLPGGEAV
jgi:hypothetical protein